MKSKNIGIEVKAPNEECTDQKCPFHSDVKLRGKQVTGTVVSTPFHRTAKVSWNYSKLIRKYERLEAKTSKVHAHVPACLDIKKGDRVRIAESRPLSKTKNFIIIQKIEE